MRFAGLISITSIVVFSTIAVATVGNALETSREIDETGGGRGLTAGPKNCTISGLASHDTPIEAEVTVELGATRRRKIVLAVDKTKSLTGECCFAKWTVSFQGSCDRPLVSIRMTQDMR